jgi:hypothetical protein
MPISDFTTLNAKLKTNPDDAWGTVPDSIKTAISTCMTGPVTAESTTSTTVAATDATSTVAP